MGFMLKNFFNKIYQKDFIQRLKEFQSKYIRGNQ